MDLLKAMIVAAAITVTVAVVVGSQGTSGGALAIEKYFIADFRLFWSWPVFLSGTGIGWGIMLLQR